MNSKDFFEQIQKQYVHELPFVIYRKPNGTQIKSLLQKDSKLHEVCDFTESGFVFAPFDKNEKATIIPIDLAESLECKTLVSSVFEIPPKPSNSLEKEIHMNVVQKAVHAINKGEFRKVVVSRRESISLEGTHPIELFKRLLYKYASAFVYCWYHPKVGLWLGATPETLLKVEGNRLSTMALAGTQKFSGTLKVNWKQKEKEEQQFVTDYIIDNLKYSVDMLHVSDVATVQAGNLIHLKTMITATIKPASLNLQEIINNLHPTPAVCGLPREKALQFILKNENYRREFYTGFLGELNLKKRTSRNSNKQNVENSAYATVRKVSDLYVNLRCMQLKDYNAIIYVGGGITKDSDPLKEWEETVEKAQVIKSIL